MWPSVFAFIFEMLAPKIISVNIRRLIICIQSGEETKAYEDAGQIATEATINIRTVASLAKEYKFYNKYVKALVVPYK